MHIVPVGLPHLYLQTKLRESRNVERTAHIITLRFSLVLFEHLLKLLLNHIIADALVRIQEKQQNYCSYIHLQS